MSSSSIPPGFSPHPEGSTTLLLPDHSDQSSGPLVFLNPVQEYNRDLSVAAIHAWSDIWGKEKHEVWNRKWNNRQQKNLGKGKKRKRDDVSSAQEEGAVNKRQEKESDKKDEVILDAMPGPVSEESASKNDAKGTSTRLSHDTGGEDVRMEETADQLPPASKPTPPTYPYTILEPLSATGLRSIRYAKELGVHSMTSNSQAEPPAAALKYVFANDLSHEAVKIMERNTEWNGVAESQFIYQRRQNKARLEDSAKDDNDGSSGSKAEQENTHTTHKQEELNTFSGNGDTYPEERGKGSSIAYRSPPFVRVNRGDACSVMYTHRTLEDREHPQFDVVDIDPYGTAAPFLDGAVQCIRDGGLLCVTCTDMTVLASPNYPEKCYSNYGGVSINAEYCHEAALRLVLHSIATAAARYGRYIKPMLSLSIDFYVRVWVRVWSKREEVKRLASQTALVYVCHDCQYPHLQPLGRVFPKPNAKGSSNLNFRTAQGPPEGTLKGGNVTGESAKCFECGGPLHIGGPMWSGPLHDEDFIERMLTRVDERSKSPMLKPFGTESRMKGMLEVAKSEITAPFFMTVSRIAGYFHCVTPPLTTIAAACINAGYQASRSHAIPGSIKTDAPRSLVHDAIRKWIETNPVKMDKIKQGSPSRRLLEKTPSNANIDLTVSKEVEKLMRQEVKLVRYQVTPPNWGPGKAAVGGKSKSKS